MLIPENIQRKREIRLEGNQTSRLLWSLTAKSAISSILALSLVESNSPSFIFTTLFLLSLNVHFSSLQITKWPNPEKRTDDTQINIIHTDERLIFIVPSEASLIPQFSIFNSDGFLRRFRLREAKYFMAQQIGFQAHLNWVYGLPIIMSISMLNTG